MTPLWCCCRTPIVMASWWFWHPKLWRHPRTVPWRWRNMRRSKAGPFRRSWASTVFSGYPVWLHATYIPISLHWPGKPVLASWMGGPDVAPGAKVLNDAGIPTYAYPDMVPLLGDSWVSFPFGFFLFFWGSGTVRKSDNQKWDQVRRRIKRNSMLLMMMMMMMMMMKLVLITLVLGVVVVEQNLPFRSIQGV